MVKVLSFSDGTMRRFYIRWVLDCKATAKEEREVRSVVYWIEAGTGSGLRLPLLPDADLRSL
jgi:hypothetical protein